MKDFIGFLDAISSGLTTSDKAINELIEDNIDAIRAASMDNADGLYDLQGALA